MMMLSDKIPHKVGCACTLSGIHIYDCDCYVGKVAQLEADNAALQRQVAHLLFIIRHELGNDYLIVGGE